MANLIQIQIGLHTVDITKESAKTVVKAIKFWHLTGNHPLPPDLSELCGILMRLTAND